MESWVWTKTKIVATMHLFFKMCKRGLYCAESMALSKHVTHYGQLSGFLYYNLTTPLRRIQPQGCTEQLCGFEPWKPSPAPSKDILKMKM